MRSQAEFITTTPRGYGIYRKENGVGGYTYFSDEIGGGTLVWDTSLVAEETMLTVLCEERRRYLEEYNAKV